MQTLEMDMAEIALALSLLPEEQPAMIWGGPGIGKTQIVERLGRNLKADVRTIVTSTYEPTDIGGVPMPVSDEGVTEYLRYLVAKWGYDATEQGNPDGGPMILFFDDLPTAHEQVQAACYRLFLDREIGDLKLRDNVRILAAGNRPDDAAATHDMPTPLGNRMLHLYARPNPDVWQKWATDEGNIHPWIVGYIRSHPDKMYTFNPDAAEKAFASPRSWHMLSKTLQSLDKGSVKGDTAASLRRKLSAGLLGS
jgi:MoxR-like ATPase